MAPKQTNSDKKADVTSDSEPTEGSSSNRPSRFEGGKLVLNRMSAPAAQRTTASSSTNPQQPPKPNPKKQLASLIAPYPTVNKNTGGVAPTASSGSKKRKLDDDEREDIEHDQPGSDNEAENARTDEEEHRCSEEDQPPATEAVDKLKQDQPAPRVRDRHLRKLSGNRMAT